MIVVWNEDLEATIDIEDVILHNSYDCQYFVRLNAARKGAIGATNIDAITVGRNS